MSSKTTTSPSPRMRARRVALLSATMLAGSLLTPAEAALFKVVVNQVQDPLLSGLSIPSNAATIGMYSGVYNWPINAITLGLLPNGKIVSYGTPVNAPGTQDGRTFDIWDPTKAGASNAHITVQGVVGVNSFCGSQAYRFDGSLISAGGIFDNGNDKGSVILNPSATAISGVSAKLANDRYYSTLLTLPNGKQIILGGTYPYAAGYANPQASINNGEMKAMTPEVFDGNQWTSLFGANSRDAFGPDNSRYWYPRAWNAPNGKVFGITSDKMWYLDTTGNGSVTTMNFLSPQKNVGSANDAPNVGPGSTAVMYDTGKILQVGGNAYTNGDGFLASNRATTIDINGATPVVKDVTSMRYGRSFANATVLPTGHVVVNGGSMHVDDAGASAVTQTEVWNPLSNLWIQGASAAIYRGYHSTAILMQNGTVLTSGGGSPGPVANQNSEIYYPPYLFVGTNGGSALAPRPQIVSLATLQLPYGQSTQFELTSQNGLSQVVLVGVGLVTHNFDSTQRRYVAGFSQSGNTVTLQTPASANIVPPGYYQLVAVDKNGVPSPGVIVAVGTNVAAPSQATTYVASAQGSNGSGGSGSGGTGSSGGTGTGTGTGGNATAANSGSGGTQVSLQASNYPANYLQNAGGTMRLLVPSSTADKQQSTFSIVPGLAGKGVSFASTATANQYLRHQNFQAYVQGNDGSDIFKQDATFQQVGSLAGSCGCSGQCVSYQSVNYPNQYLRHRNFYLYLQQPDGSDLFKQDASFCLAQPLSGGSAVNSRPLVSSQSGLCLSVPAGNKDDRAPVTQQNCTGAAEQQWRPIAGNGGTAYMNVASGKCLDQSLDTQPAGPGAMVYQYTCLNVNNQAWTPKPVGGGSNLVSVNSNLCLGVLGGTGQVGSGTVGWTCNGAADQIFTSSSQKL